MVEFGNTLKTLRLQNNFTQAQLAQRLGVTKSVISAYETGLRMPSYDVLISISQIFKVTTDYLLGLEKKQELDLSGLTEDEVQALTELIKAMKRRSGDFGSREWGMVEGPFVQIGVRVRTVQLPDNR